MEFEWDETKRKQVIEKHRVDFVYAALIFEGFVITAVDDRHDYGEVRYISSGMVDDELFVVVHTPREDVTRLITAWKGGRDERSHYEKSIAERSQENEGEG